MGNQDCPVARNPAQLQGPWRLMNKPGTDTWAMKSWCLQTVVLEKTPESPLNFKEINPEYSLEGLMLKMKLQYFGHLMWKADLLEKTPMLGKIEGRRRRGWQRTRWLDGITNWMDMTEQILGNSEGQGSLACCSPWGYKESGMTEWLNNKTPSHEKNL